MNADIHNCPYGEHGQLCERVKNLQKVAEQSQIDHDAIWSGIKDKAPMALMRWLIGGLFLMMVTMAGWGGILWKNITINASCLAVMQTDIKHIAKGVEKIERNMVTSRSHEKKSHEK